MLGYPCTYFMSKDRIWTLLIATLGIVALLLLALSGFKNCREQTNITFNVTGITNATNSSLIAIHFECIKFCSNEFYGSDASYRLNLCYTECSRIGQEICDCPIAIEGGRTR
jgi:hypothetical protein